MNANGEGKIVEQENRHKTGKLTVRVRYVDSRLVGVSIRKPGTSQRDDPDGHIDLTKEEAMNLRGILADEGQCWPSVDDR